MQNLFTLRFWFNLNPAQLLAPFRYGLIALIAAFIIVSVVAALKRNKKGPYQKTFRRLYDLGVTGAITGLLLLFFDYEQVPFFSARFWLGIWVIGLAVWLAYIIKPIRSMAARQQEREKEAQFKKYLP